MIRHILFPYDFSRQGSEVVPYVRALAAKSNAKVTLFSVVPPVWQLPPAGMQPIIGPAVPEWVDALQDRLGQLFVDELAGLQVDRVAESGDVALKIVDFADANGVDLIMMPTHGLGTFRRYLVGSVTSRVLHTSTCPMWTAEHTEAHEARVLPQTILCSIGATPRTPALLRWAAGFAADIGATLKLLHVVGPITDWPSLQRERALQEQIRREARALIESMQRSAGLDAPLRVVIGDIVSAAGEEARQENADLLIIGRGSVGEPFGRLRTHTFGVIQRSPCPVLSV